jgi:taurine dioxygenase
MLSRPFEIRPIGGALGAELHGIDLSADISDETITAVRQALLDHLVIFFRDQELPPDRFLALARRFGTPIEYPFVKGIEGFPEIINVAKLEHEKINFGGVWHSDTTYLQEPPMATLLVARDVPEAGGDTIFANQYLALAALSDTLRGKLSTLRGVASSAKADASRTREDRIRAHGSADARNLLVAEHPVIPRPVAKRSTSTARTPSLSVA